MIQDIRLLFFLPLLSCLQLNAQVTATHNYVLRTVVKVPGATTPAQVTTFDIQRKQETVTYFDGLGRPQQSVNIRQSPGTKDIISPVEYDQYGRTSRQYLPYADVAGTAYGNFRSNVFNDQLSFYNPSNTSVLGIARDQRPVSQTVFEFSPLDRVVEKGAAGKNWQPGSGHATKLIAAVNTTAEEVKHWEIAATIDAIPTAKNYTAGDLMKQITVDEQGKQLVVYTDIEGKTVLQKLQMAAVPGVAHTGWLCTYYVYDDFNNLRMVIPPKAVDAISSNWSFTGRTDVLNELCFRYEYDEKGRQIIKKVPGAASVEMVYDSRDRLVFSRDGNMKDPAQDGGAKWLATFYDSRNRPAMSAFYKSTASRTTLQQNLNAAVGSSKEISYTIPGITNLQVAVHDGRETYEATSTIEFTDGFDTKGSSTNALINPAANQGTVTVTVNNPLPSITSAELYPLSYTFYDDYTYNAAYTLLAGDLNKPQPGTDIAAERASTYNRMPGGLKTGVKTRVLGTDQWLTTTIFYDDKGRALQTLSDNIMGGKNVKTSLYSFNDKLLSHYVRATNPQNGLTPEIRTLTVLGYDHADRLIRVSKQVNDTGILKVISQQNYNETGQLYTKTIGSNLETYRYDYNIRGWLTGMNKDYLKDAAASYFGYELAYDQPASVVTGSTYTTPVFNGNIAGTTWRSKTNGVKRKYDFSYDPVNRLLKAGFLENVTGAWNNTTVNYTVKMGDGVNPVSAYDPNGNILAMTQYGLKGTSSSTIDDLQYKYLPNSNKLRGVKDLANDPLSALGDFKELKGSDTTDYNYDANGNLTQDFNKDIPAGGIKYNYLNLPERITIGTKGTIEYLYDANGNKLRKIVTDKSSIPNKTIITDYSEGFVYQNDTLQFFDHEEGRVRMVYKAGKTPACTYDYFVKDHLTNTRMVLTEQSDFTMYTATMETSRAPVENALFSNLDATRTDKPAGYPTDDAAGENNFVAKLNARSEGKKIGPSLVLRVMAGDTIQIGARAFYKSTGPQQQQQITPPVEDMVANLAQTFTGESAVNGVHGSSTSNTVTPFTTTFYNNDYQRLKEKATNQQQQDKPQAYLNFVLFDDQFNLVEDNSGVKQVKAEPDQLQTLAQDEMPVTKSGYLYVYTTNESQQDVFFDNVTLGLKTGPVLEETHYYPFGGTMVGISSNALKGEKYPENRNRFTSQLLDNELELNWYQFRCRNMDPQIGRFIQIDPLSIKYTGNSPYTYAENKVTMGVDLEGLELLPFNSAWFKMNTLTKSVYGTKSGSQYNQVEIISNNVPSVFKDETGALLFSASSVGISPSGIISTSHGPMIRPANDLPVSPEWAFSNGDPESTGYTGGWAIGRDLDQNKDFADKISAVGGLPQEAHNWITTFRDNIPIWEGLNNLQIQRNTFDASISAVGGKPMGISSRKSDVANVVNFVNDGSLPSLDLKNFKGSLQNIIKIMDRGMKIMDEKGINIRKNTKEQYKAYSDILEIFKGN